MPRYTVQTTFAFDKSQETRAVIPDPSASLVVEFWNGATWTTDEKSPITKPTSIYTNGVTVRITPTGGGFMIDGVQP